MFVKNALLSAGLGLLMMTSVMTTNASESNLSPEVQNKIVGVRINDIASFIPSSVPGIASIAANIKSHPGDFFTNGKKVDVVHDVFFNHLPEINGEQIRLRLTAFVKYKDGNADFEKMSIEYTMRDGSPRDYVIQHEESYSSKDMQFKASVGLIERKLILEDRTHDVKIVFPIGVGSFEEGVLNEGQYSLLTPRFKNGYIDQRNVITKRERPRYFQGKPFIRLSKGADLADATPIAFHIEINDSFVRGFDSHGCMRLREMDLLALHDLIMMGTQVLTPITIQYRTKDSADHPAPKRNEAYKGVLNQGTKDSPFFVLDKDNLIQLVYKEGAVPTDKLVDQDNDNYQDLFNYDTAPQMAEQDIRRKNECDAKVMRGELDGTNAKKYQACLDAGKRKDSLKDRIYRRYMGINSGMIIDEQLF